MKRNLYTGFTLIELLVVITIIGILIGLSVFGMAGARESSRDARRKADLELIRSGLELYRSDCGAYPHATWTTNWPTRITGGGSTGYSPSPVPSSCMDANVVYVNVPSDPASPARNYSYYSLNGTIYEICTALEQGSGTANCSASCGVTGVTCNWKVTNP